MQQLELKLFQRIKRFKQGLDKIKTIKKKADLAKVAPDDRKKACGSRKVVLKMPFTASNG
jgi:hypothetical protein